MVASVEEVAEQMRVAAGDPTESVEVLRRLLAPTVELRHEPPGPHDGPIDREVLADTARREVEAIGRALPDGFERTADITVQGDTIEVTNRLTGTLPGGRVVEVATQTVFTVADGAIVGLRAALDPENADRWRALLSEGGVAQAHRGEPEDRPKR